MNKELIVKLIERAKLSADNAYCPYTNHPIGCALLVDENIIFGGCNIECGNLCIAAGAGEVAVMKAISEGYTRFKAICFYATKYMPYPNGVVAQMLHEFNPFVKIVVATDETYTIHSLYELFPFLPEGPVIE